MERISKNELRKLLSKMDLSDIDKYYTAFHLDRYVLMLNLIDKITTNRTSDEKIKILDIGPAYQTFLIREFFPKFRIDSLGYQHPFNVLRQGEVHYYINLNEIQEKPIPPEEGKYDIILFNEVIEHLYTDPASILIYFYKMLSPNGFLLIQTPNAVAIHKRIKMFFGINPFQMLHSSRMGHFREYTRNELKQLCLEAGFKIHKQLTQNYFGSDHHPLHFIFKRVSILLPPAWRDGITLIAQKTQIKTEAETTKIHSPRTKYDIINFLGTKYNYKSYLEISSLGTGGFFDKVDPTIYICKDVINYHVAEYEDLYALSTTSLTNDHEVAVMPFEQHFDRVKSTGIKFDCILVDSFHTLEASNRDLYTALELLAPHGTMVVHDCLPSSEDLIGDYKKEAWCGQSYEAYINFVWSHDFDHFVIDSDYGCGIIRPFIKTDRIKPDIHWGSLSDWTYLWENRHSFLLLRSTI